MERVIHRSDLQSENSSISSSPEPEATEILRRIEDFDIVDPAAIAGDTIAQHGDAADVDAEEDEYEFRLFGAPKATANEVPAGKLQKIRLRSPSISKNEAGLIQPERHLSYYFTKPLSDVEKENFESAALTGEQIVSQARKPWPGSSYSWKILHLPVTNVNISIRTQEHQPFKNIVEHTLPAKRKRPGKKYRIKLRNKQAVLKAQQDASKAAAESKEAADREKRTRRNREKKVKKKLRVKANKSAGTSSIPELSLPRG